MKRMKNAGRKTEDAVMSSAVWQQLHDRLHILPDTLARSPTTVGEHFPTPMALLATVAQGLTPLPLPLREAWLAAAGGHLVLTADCHGFVPGPQPFRRETLTDVAWLRAALWLSDRTAFFEPVGWLIYRLLTDRFDLEAAMTSPSWASFWRGLESGWQAGYGLTEAARTDIRAYLAEGIAGYLGDRMAFNQRDPRLEKLLAATLFNAHFYRHLPRRA
jgi:hypothetical protein